MFYIPRTPYIALSLLILPLLANAGRDEAAASGLPLVSMTQWHGPGYGDFQIRGDKNDRILVVGTPGFDDSYCAFVVKHDTSVSKVGGLILCRCDQILYNGNSSKTTYGRPTVEVWQATDSKLFSNKNGWVDTTLVYIESDVCTPAPCCYENVTKTPDFPPGFVPNFRKGSTTVTATSTIKTTATEEKVEAKHQGIGAGIIAAIAIGCGVRCSWRTMSAMCDSVFSDQVTVFGCGAGLFYYWRHRNVSQPKPKLTSAKTEKQN